MKKKPVISLIAAIGKNRELGYKKQLIWKIPEDLNFFRKTTEGHPVIMGQKTFESIGRILPNRLNIILSKDKNLKIPGGVVSNSIDEAIGQATKVSDEVFVIGGGQIYSQTINCADRLYLTIIEKSGKADTYFPYYSSFKAVKEIKSGEFEGLRYRTVIFEKNSSSRKKTISS